MPLTNSIPTIVGNAVLESLKKNLVYRNLFNENYTGNVAPGNAVTIVSPGSVTVGDYTVYTDMTEEAVTDSGQTLIIDQQKYYNIVIDDVDAAMARPNVMAAYANEAVYQMGETIDSYLAGLLAAGGDITADLGDDTTPLEINSANAPDVLQLIARKLDDAKVPRDGRIVVLPPWYVEDMVAANLSTLTNNTEVAASGFVGRYAGFNILMSNNVPNTANERYKIIAGSNIAATMAIAISETERLRHQKQFADILRGLAVYGGKVTRSAALAVATCNEAA